MTLSTTTDFDETSTTAAEFNAQKIVQSNSPTLSTDVNVLVEKALRRTKYLDNIKVDIAGDTMTGRLIVGTSTAGQNGIETTGNTTGAGITGTGGNAGSGGIFTAGGGNKYGVEGFGSGTATGVYAEGGATGSGADLRAGGGNGNGATCLGSGSGSGVVGTGGSSGKGGAFVAGGGNADGLSATGNGTGAGTSCVGGATGPGLTAVSGTAQTNTAPTCAAQFAGYVQLTGTAPNAGVNPGANNVLHVSNICHARCTIELATGGPFAPISEYNIDNVSETATGIYVVQFKRIMSVADFTPMLTCRSKSFEVHVSSTTTTVVEINVFDFATRNLSGGTVTVDLLVFAQQ